jgi:putative addiction module component (TIGR02574 family)
MATLTKAELDAMSIDERFALIDDIQVSLHDALEAAGPPDWHKIILDERLDDAERFPQDSIPWEKVKEEMAKKWLR